MAAGSCTDWYKGPNTGGAGGVAYVGVYGRTTHYYQASYQGNIQPWAWAPFVGALLSELKIQLTPVQILNGVSCVIMREGA